MRAEQRAALSNTSSMKLAALRAWAASCVPATDDDESIASYQEMEELVQRLVAEQKEDLHQERFFATLAGMFENMWATVLLRMILTIPCSSGARIG